jgi:hypothetical protein
LTVAATQRQQHNSSMASVRTPPMSPDLLSDAAAWSASSPSKFSPAATPTPTGRHILPNNLPAAIKQLEDVELDRLLSAIRAELDRRGRRTPAVDNGAPKPQHHVDISSLSVGKLNAIRAAFKAGVRPARIAREFGVSEADVRKALAADRVRR